MRDNGSLVPLAIVLLIVGGIAYFPRTTAPPAGSTASGARPAGDVANGRAATGIVQLLGDHFALDIGSLTRRRAIACARDLLQQAGADKRAALLGELQQQLSILLDVPPETVVAELIGPITPEVGGSDAGACAGAAGVNTQFARGDRQALQLEVLYGVVAPRADVRFLTAMVPDPIDSNGRWQFDPIVDALQRAVAESGYVLDRFSLPDWDPSADPDRGFASKRHETEPGTVLFRAAAPCGRNDETCAGRERLLVVFLAYETPTAGAHQVALQRALSTAVRWQRLQHEASPMAAILGPTYSGSVGSLRQVLGGLRNDEAVRGGVGLNVRIVSGSATADDNKTAIEALSDRRCMTVSYHATVWPNSVMVGRLLDHLAETRRPWSRGRSALLVEGNTSFGQNILGLEVANVVQFPFPLHISRLRSVAARERPAERPRSPLSRFLPLSLDDPSTPTDQMPSLSPRSTAASVELVGANILSTIRREEIASVGIFATDTRDKLFLAQLIQQFSPDVMVFTTEPDLLFTHPDYRRYTRGIVFSSTYPLFTGIQPSTVAGRRRVQFGSMSAQGVYNATIALLNYDDTGSALPASLRASEDAAPEMLDYGLPNVTGYTRPPLWIGVSGRDGIWPVRYITIDEATSLLFPYNRVAGPQSALSARPDLSPWLTALLIAMLAVSVHHLARLNRPVRAFRPPRLFDFGHYAARDRGYEARSPYLAVCLLALLPFLALGAVLSTGVIGPDPPTRGLGWARWVWPVNLTLWIALAAGVLIAVWSLWPALRKELRRSARWGRGLFYAMACLLALEAITGVWFLLDVSRPDKLRAFVERAGHPMNGVSPVGPLILLTAGLYFWASAQLQRVSHRCKADAVVKSSTEQGYRSIAAGQLGQTLDEVCALVAHPVSSMKPRLRYGAFALTGASVVLVAVRGWSTIEHWSFGVYLVIGLLITQGIVVLWLAQLLDMWFRTREVMRALAADTLGSAFANMPLILFSDRFAVRFPGSRKLARIAAEAAQLETGLDDVAANVPPGSHKDAPEAATVATAVSGAVQISQLAFAVSATIPDMTVPPVRVEVTPPPQPRSDQPASWVPSVRDALRGMAALKFEGHPENSETAWEHLVAHGSVLRSALFRPCLRARLRGELDADRDRSDAWLRRAESLVVMPLAVVVRDLIAMVAQTLLLASGAVVLLVACLAILPVHSRQTLVGLAWADVFALSMTALVIFVQADRDELLSRLTNTPPGKVTWDAAFVSKMFVYVGLPLVSLFASQFPEVADALSRWLGSLQSQAL